MSARPLPRDAYRQLTAALAHTVHAVPGQGGAMGGTAAAAARHTRVCARTIGYYLDHEAPQFPPLDVVADLQAASGSLAMAEALAALAGCGLYRLPQGRSAPDGAQALRVLRESGETTAAISGLLAEAAPSPAQTRRVLGELDDLILAAASLRHELAAASLRHELAAALGRGAP